MAVVYKPCFGISMSYYVILKPHARKRKRFVYRIYLIKRPGVYFISKSVKGAFKRGRLFKEGVY